MDTLDAVRGNYTYKITRMEKYLKCKNLEPLNYDVNNMYCLNVTDICATQFPDKGQVFKRLHQ